MAEPERRPTLDLTPWKLTVGQGRPPVQEGHVLTPDDEIISDPEKKQGTTRRILRPDVIHANVHDPTARVGVTLVHQKRGTNAAKSGAWEDAEPFSLSSLRAGQEAQFNLSHRETKRLFKALARMYRERGDLFQILGEADIAVDERTVTADGVDVRNLVDGWFRNEPSAFFKVVEQMRPELVRAEVLRRTHAVHVEALEAFESHMLANDWTEHDWQAFFDANRWIFGFGLSFCFLSTVQDQPVYVGAGVSGSGAQRGDFLMRTEAEVRFTVLVEIKRPDTKLLHHREHRPGVYHESQSLSEAVAQVQANAENWLRHGSMTKDAGRTLESEQRTFTHQPKSILIVGRTSDLSGDPDKIGSFERYRKNLLAPEVLTFDELLMRARHLVETQYDGPADRSCTFDDLISEMPI